MGAVVCGIAGVTVSAAASNESRGNGGDSQGAGREVSGEQLLVAVPKTGRLGGGRWYRLLPKRITDEEKAAALATAADTVVEGGK